ncbi:lamin b receptor [Streptomyces laurentii]|uniref:Lamin b receptor n=1 Tax=Streptomyces laurentii TaxID=39478 RepID=A0A160P6K9_STRLU|nr:lamin b receptor [Streptomyces laurentii]
MVAGHQPFAGPQLIALPRQDLVREAGRQVEQSGRVGDQRTVSGVVPAERTGTRRAPTRSAAPAAAAVPAKSSEKAPAKAMPATDAPVPARI